MMKILFPLFAPLLFLASFASAQTDSAGLQRYFGIKSVKIVYKFINGPQSGEKTIIFDDWGRKYKEEVTTISDTAIMNRTVSVIRQYFDSIPHTPTNDSLKQAFSAEVPLVQHNLRIRTAGQVYSIDLDRNIGYQQPDMQLSPGSFLDQSEVRKDTLLGRPCEVIEFQGAFQIWYWQKIPVKKEIVQKVEGMRVEEYAIIIDENYRIRPDEFKIPASVKMQ